MKKEARLSDDGKYRYLLTRHWGDGFKHVVFIMLNPSTADADVDDPTIRRCIAFARAAGADGLRVMNLFEYRATRPKDLYAILGEPQDEVILRMQLNEIRKASAHHFLTIVAWGAPANKRVRDRIALVLPLLTEPKCLGVTKDGHPRHPLYVRGDVKPVPYPVQRP